MMSISQDGALVANMNNLQRIVSNKSGKYSSTMGTAIIKRHDGHAHDSYAAVLAEATAEEADTNGKSKDMRRSKSAAA